jgi:hypothetical protein
MMHDHGDVRVSGYQRGPGEIATKPTHGANCCDNADSFIPTPPNPKPSSIAVVGVGILLNEEEES